MIDIKYIVEEPNYLTEQQRQYFQKLLKLQGQVENPTMDKITSCSFLCLAYDNELPIGIGAIKKVYKTPFDKANVTKLKDKYDFELGYLFVLDKKKYREKGIAKTICSELLNKTEDENIFATTEESETNSMKWILKKFDFIKTGETYVGMKTKKNIGLYLLEKNNRKKSSS